MDKSIEATGAGPFTLESPSLAPGEAWRIDLNSYEKGKYQPYTPFDQLLIKNYDDANRVDLEVNGRTKQFVDVDPNGKDTYGDSGVRTFRVVNRGGATIAAGDVTITVKRDPYGADDQAREELQRSPLEKVARSFIGL